MPRPSPRKLSPWIEHLILNYDGQEGSSNSSGRLEAYVIGVGQMSGSQVQGSECPTGLLFLSDGVLQIPAVLTASAWEHLQEQEDRECFSSLINTTVCIPDYRLQFHMTPEQTKCRFFLLVGELATTAAGPVKDNTPLCTTLSSVRLKIFKTWRALLGTDTQDSQKSQCAGFDLSELLGEWQHDCLQTVLEDVRERLVAAKSRSVTLPQPSTSTSVLNDAVRATSWDVDRVRFKGRKCFSVPIKCLFIPEGEAEQPQTPLKVGSGRHSGLSAISEDRKGDLLRACIPSKTTQSSGNDMPAVTQRCCDTKENSPAPVEDFMLHEDMITEIFDSSIRRLSNPWDIFPPPCGTSSSSDTSPEATPAHSLHQASTSRSKPDRAAVLTSTQLHVNSSKESQQTTEHSFFPPYQKPQELTSPPAATSPLEKSHLSPAPDGHNSHTTQKNISPLEQESQILAKDMEETFERKCRKAKRKRSKSTPETLGAAGEEEGQVSPPSWLFDTQAGCGAEVDNSHKQGQTLGTVLRKTSTIHSDGNPFSYTYHISGQNLQDFSRFKVDEPLLKWALSYLVVQKQTNHQNNTSVTSSQTSSDVKKVA